MLDHNIHNRMNQNQIIRTWLGSRTKRRRVYFSWKKLNPPLGIAEIICYNTKSPTHVMNRHDYSLEYMTRIYPSKTDHDKFGMIESFYFL